MSKKPTKKQSDLFDRLFDGALLKPLQPFYLKHKEKLLYLFFGGLTTLISIAVFALFTKLIPLNVLLANVLSWVIAVLFAFVTNRTWVFQPDPSQGVIKQMLLFYLGRVATLLVEEVILLCFVELLTFDEMIVKVAAQILVIILNYVISKILVFKSKA
ncbi:MAG: GtrA family protein [Clostridia bacterium]|nr:GtrA family protein [Clostridia bacterium]